MQAVVGTLLWGHCCGDTVVGRLLRVDCCGKSVVGRLMWGDCYLCGEAVQKTETNSNI